MPVVEKVKKPIVPSEEAPIAEDLSIEKPKTRKPPTEAMKEAGRKNLEKGRLALQEKRKASVKPPTEPNVKPVQEVAPPPATPATPNRPRTKKVIYQEESESEDEVIIVKKKKKAPKKKYIYEDESDEEEVLPKKQLPGKPIAEQEPPVMPRHVQQPSAVLRWI